MHYPLPATLPDLSKTTILVVGDVMLDRYLFGDTARISPEAPVPIVHVRETDNRPGGAANVAANIAALGAKVTLLGITGQDEAGQMVEEQLTAARVKTDLHRDKNVSTIIKLRVISRKQQLLRLDFEDKLLPSAEDVLIERFKAHLAQANLVILSDYKKGTLANPQAFIQLARAANIPVLVDPKGHDFSIYQDAEILTPNQKEFEAIVGPCRSEQDILEKGRALLAQYHIKNLLVTRGEQGMTLIQPGQDAVHLPAYACEVCDVTGAGDTVIATLGMAVAAGLNLVEATALSNLAASLAIARLGATPISLPEIQDAMGGPAQFATGIVNDEQLLLAIKTVRAQGKKVVFTNGCFDIFHAGHATFLKQAKELGDYLVVAVNDDQSIKRLKGPGRPINHQEHRMMVLASLGTVDWVVPFADDTPERLLRIIQPDLLVKGGEYSLDQVVGADIVTAYGGEIRIVLDKIASTTDIIERIQNQHSKTTSSTKENHSHD